MARGEIWWATVDSEWPIVLLSSGEAAEFEAIQIVAPATAAQRQGFIILSPETAADDRARAAALAEPAVGGVGIEVPFGSDEGLARPGVVRVALPSDGRIFCTWQLTVARESLIAHVGTSAAPKMRQLDLAIRLAGYEPTAGAC